MPYALAALSSSVFLAACTSIAPDSLKAPKQVSCIEIPAGMAAHEKLGLLHIPWIFTAGPGPYLSEREDALGVYYRAPQGGISVWRDKDDDGDDSMQKKAPPAYMDGGIWLPRDAAQPPHLYSYLGTRSYQPGAVPDGASCANAVLLPAPKPGDVNAVAFAVAGGAGGAAGGLAGRSMARNSSMSYGQSAGIGLAGGAIGGLIVAKLIDMENGHISNMAPLTDPRFIASLREAAKAATPVLPAAKSAKEAEGE